MTPEQFCYWLQGHLEISKTKTLTGKQVEEIKNHLALVFKKVTPGGKEGRQLEDSLRSLAPAGIPICAGDVRYC